MPHQPKHPKKILSAAERVRPIEGHLVVDIHSDNGHLIINGQHGSAADLAAMIKQDPAWHPGQPVVLMSCDTGGPESIESAVAKHLDTAVTAPDHLACQHADMTKLVATVREVMASHPETKSGVPLWHQDWVKQHLSPRELKEY